MSLITNGTILKKFAEVLSATALDGITLSLHTLDKNKYKEISNSNINSELNDILEGLEKVQKFGINNIKINTVLFKRSDGLSNICEIPTVIHYCKTRNIKELRFYSIFWNNNSSVKKEDFISLNNNEVLELLSGSLKIPKSLINNKIELWNNYLQKSYSRMRIHIPSGNTTIVLSLTHTGVNINNSYCIICRYRNECFEGQCPLRITADGKMRGCLLSDREINILAEVRKKQSLQSLEYLYREGMNLIP